MPRACYHRDFMPTGNGHQIYYELNGNPAGIPVLVIHGGPGAGLAPNYTDAFDLSAYHVIGFEQRGCGRSTPYLSLQANTTQDLLEDISSLRRQLAIKQWLLYGGSWGTTLALLAAINEPETISGLILRGIFLARQEDFHWFLAPDGGAAQVYPDAYQQFVKEIPAPVDLDAVMAYYRHIFTGNDEKLRQQAALRWYQWEEAIARVYSPLPGGTSMPVNPAVVSLAILEWHYIANQCFIEENAILESAHRLAGIRGSIIHGRCDTVCKPQGAFKLHQLWPDSQLTLVDGAGHSSAEPGIAMALREATHQFKLSNQKSL